MKLTVRLINLDDIGDDPVVMLADPCGEFDIPQGVKNLGVQALHLPGGGVELRVIFNLPGDSASASYTPTLKVSLI
jgi:hypothetical protein